MTLGEFDIWAESLQDGLTRVIGENLAAMMPTNRIRSFPWRRAVALDYQVAVQVISFGGDAGGRVFLTARWSVMGPVGERLRKGKTSLTQVADSQEYADIVVAMSQVVNGLSGEIADGIKSLKRAP